MRLVSIDIQEGMRCYHWVDDEGKARYEEEYKGDKKQSFIGKQLGIPWTGTQEHDGLRQGDVDGHKN